MKCCRLILTSALVFSMLLSYTLGCVYAERKPDNEEKVPQSLVLYAKKILNIADDFDTFNTDISTRKINDREEKVYRFNWNKEGKEYKYIAVDITPEKRVLSYSFNSFDADDNKVSNKKIISYEEAQKTAEKFLNTVDPTNAKYLKLVKDGSAQNLYSQTYEFYFERYYNNIRVFGDQLRISVNKYENKVRNYDLSYSYSPDFSNVSLLKNLKSNMSKEDALKVYKNNDYFKSVIRRQDYMGSPAKSDYKKDNSPYFVLIYTNELNRCFFVDASSKEYVYSNDAMLLNHAMKSEGAYDKREDLDAQNSLSPYEIKTLDRIEGLKSEEELEKTARSYFNLGKEYTLENKNTGKRNLFDDDYFTSFTFKNTKSDNNNYRYVSLNSKNGILYNYGSDFYEKNPVDIKAEQIKALADKYIDKFAKDVKNNLIYVKSSDDANSVSYYRVLDGNIVKDDKISMYFAAKNLTSYLRSWYNKNINYDKNTVDVSKIYEKTENVYGLNLAYLPDFSDKNVRYRLVYAFGNPYDNFSFMAKNAENIYTDPYSQNFYYDDIEQSAYKDDISLLLNFGIKYPENKLLPNEKLKQKDFIYLLYGINSFDAFTKDIYERCYNMAIDDKLLSASEINREKFLTKLDIAKILIRKKGYDDLCKYDIFKNVFKDEDGLSPEDKGFLNIAYSLKYIKADGNNINMNKIMTRDEGSEALYKFLFD